uniref:hydroxyacylglutathione hydrolase n=1 Tax=Sexangularia sp. CB-2014 TaxID=1486929 RepID=A0A7S1V5N4_9EUKA|mmetsp:Transcript_11022/g.34980  ORF Transcript_11022/g.34980 Transcript_11022/m.34980 type:complete len:322 (+) Transcript_11022:300-1265(+)
MYDSVIVDCGDTAALSPFLDAECKPLVFLTHGHLDHMSGVPTLQRTYKHCTVRTPPQQPSTTAAQLRWTSSQTLAEASRSLSCACMTVSLTAAAVPAHTSDSVILRMVVRHTDARQDNLKVEEEPLGCLVSSSPDGPPAAVSQSLHAGCAALFTGDTLFACGAGRFFTSTVDSETGLPAAATHLACLVSHLTSPSLDPPPARTLVLGGHEYGAANRAFARTLEPTNEQLRDNPDAVDRDVGSWYSVRGATLARELDTNPFLRLAASPSLRASLNVHADATLPVALAALRTAKDSHSPLTLSFVLSYLWLGLKMKAISWGFL